MTAAVFLLPITLIALLPLIGKMDQILVDAIVVATLSVMVFIQLPGSSGSFMQIGGINFWIFTISNSMALVISATVICVHLAFKNVEAATWRKIKECTRKAMIVALFSFAVASLEVVVTVIDNQPSMRLIATSSFITMMGSTLMLVLYLMYGYPK